MLDYNKTFVNCCNPRASLDERINARGKSHQQHMQKLKEELEIVCKRIEERQQQLQSCDTYIRFHTFLHKTRNDPNSTQPGQVAFYESQKVSIIQELEQLKERRNILYSKTH